MLRRQADCMASAAAAAAAAARQQYLRRPFLLRHVHMLMHATRAATCMNEASSRSHCIVTVTVDKACPDGCRLVGKLKMVDLAGR